ncbi:unnamed protein product [Coffea canephora]|uniref:DH200=94 genomic scaffold, scaffold_1181 n=1 Tax=Coffea canephora TaxID=49390 RepID=A0A068VI67_COFCA|nr:unnamed protein product [Coffea canephora]
MSIYFCFCFISVFQYEGAHDADGRGASIWDTFLKENYPVLFDFTNTVAINGLNAEDKKIMKEMGFNTFRLSISWPRVLPYGRRTYGPNGEEQGVNKKGIDFYNNVINLLLENGNFLIQPIFLFALFEALKLTFIDLKSCICTKDFIDYTDPCFREFGDRVKLWLTFNETWTYSLLGYMVGSFAPSRGATLARCLAPRAGDPTTEPYIVTQLALVSCSGSEIV